MSRRRSGGGPRVLVVGAGVIGLSTAIRLREAGFDADVWAAGRRNATTSSVAAAIFYPYRARPADKVKRWGNATRRELERLARRRGTGVSSTEAIEIMPRRRRDPEWKRTLRGFRYARPAELPEGYRHGLVFRIGLIEMTRYLPWLEARYRALGGRVATRRVQRLDDVPERYAGVLHCAGLGAKPLAGDERLYPIRGQIVRVRQVGLERVWLDQFGPGGLTYIVPRSRDIVLGGTAEDGDWSMRPRQATAKRILASCVRLEPRLAGAKILEHRVGLRPGRTSVRLTTSRLRDGRPLVHNYGHGGAGVTLSWGCADEAVSRLRAALRRGR